MVCCGRVQLLMTWVHPCAQVLVYHDLLGMMQHPHHAKVTPKFCKQYAAVGAAIQEALQSYAEEVLHSLIWHLHVLRLLHKYPQPLQTCATYTRLASGLAPCLCNL